VCALWVGSGHSLAAVGTIGSCPALKKANFELQANYRQAENAICVWGQRRYTSSWEEGLFVQFVFAGVCLVALCLGLRYAWIRQIAWFKRLVR
jgi:hypothetical protein